MAKQTPRQCSIKTGIKALESKLKSNEAKILELEEDINFYTDKTGDLCEAKLLCSKADLVLRKAMTKQLNEVIEILKDLK